MPVTEAVAQPNAAQQALERRLGPQAVVDVDAATGTPRVLARLDGTLTGATSGAPEDVALSYVRRNLDVLGLTEADLATLEPAETSARDGVTEVRWRQAVDGIPAADSELRVNVTDDGRVLNVLGSPAPDLDPGTTPSLTPGEAVRSVQEEVGVYRALPRDSGPAGATRATEYADGSDGGADALQGRAGLAGPLLRVVDRGLRRVRRRQDRARARRRTTWSRRLRPRSCGSAIRVRRWAGRSSRSTSRRSGT